MQLPNMNYRKGLFRAWAALSVVWVVFVAAVSLPSVFDLVEKKSVLAEMTPIPLPFEPSDERAPRPPMTVDMAQKIEIVQKIENDISRLKGTLMEHLALVFAPLVVLSFALISARMGRWIWAGFQNK